LTGAGFSHYEVSNYSKNNRECRHNQNYWEQGEYFSFGPSAHGYLSNKRYWNYRSNHKYFEQLENNELPTEDYEILKRDEIILERIYLELRAGGLDFKRFQNDFGIDLFSKMNKIKNLFFEDKIEMFNESLLKLNSDGYFAGDSITLELLNLIDSENI